VDSAEGDDGSDEAEHDVSQRAASGEIEGAEDGEGPESA